MREKIHPKWYPEAKIICACGNTWITGATVPEIRTDICSKCHPFYTGEQRIVDTEGQVDRFLKRLQIRDSIRTEAEERLAARTSPNIALSEFETELGKQSKRYLNILAEHGIEVVGDFIKKLEEGGEESLLEIPGIGRKIIADLRRLLTSRGYELPAAQ